MQSKLRQHPANRALAATAKPRRALAAVLAACLLAACAHEKPVLYGDQGAGDRAVDECIAQAQSKGLDYGRGEPVKNAAKSGAVGAAGGAAAGAIYGSAGRGAAAGAAGGAAVSLVRGVFGSREPSPVFKRYVDRCLRERGYDPIGWQ